VPDYPGCTIHEHRNAVCRTWFCKSVNGARGWAAQMALKELLRAVEQRVAHHCVERRAPPRAGADAASWEAWYRQCGEGVDGLTAVDVAQLQTSEMNELLGTLLEIVQLRDTALPDVLIPTVHSWVVETDRVTISGYSHYDHIDVPTWIFVFLAELDGVVGWQEARHATESSIGEPVPIELIARLYRFGVIGSPQLFEPPSPSDMLPSD
jgi:hypothetical protein